MDFLMNIKALGIEGATLAMFVTLVGLLLTGMPLAFVTLLVALIFALGWMGPHGPATDFKPHFQFRQFLRLCFGAYVCANGCHIRPIRHSEGLV
ncbi:hypothetical protein SAMN04488056_11295 [Cohaesibacter marisflavi]|uniref:Uncharacterized protein n=1 Tax=Cohaesibacter marisflavi TaxID=655353 RepID=A0A1I5JTW1_9HYPH|nr:hypothetical protein SAMN04488056_11295 [Cohaesibacter marisflavi]